VFPSQGIRTSSRVLQSLALRSLDFAALSSPRAGIVLQREVFFIRNLVEDSLQAVTGTAVSQGTLRCCVLLCLAGISVAVGLL